MFVLHWMDAIGFDPAVGQPIVDPLLFKAVDDEHRVRVDK